MRSWYLFEIGNYLMVHYCLQRARFYAEGMKAILLPFQCVNEATLRIKTLQYWKHASRQNNCSCLIMYIYVYLWLCLCILVVWLCIFIVPTDTLRLPWLRFFRAFSSAVRQMPGCNWRRLGTACILWKWSCCS